MKNPWQMPLLVVTWAFSTFIVVSLTFVEITGQTIQQRFGDRVAWWMTGVDAALICAWGWCLWRRDMWDLR